MTSKLTAALLAGAAALAITLSNSAEAQVREVWDSQGVQVGTFYVGGIIHTFPDRVDRLIGFWRNTVDIDYYAFYESPDCTGPRFFFGGDSATLQQLVHNAFYEGSPSPGSMGRTYWAPQEGVIVSQHKYGSAWDGHESLGNTPTCYRGDDQLYWMTPQVKVDTTSQGFSPPFCESHNVGQCLGKNER